MDFQHPVPDPFPFRPYPVPDHPDLLVPPVLALVPVLPDHLDPDLLPVPVPCLYGV